MCVHQGPLGPLPGDDLVLPCRRRIKQSVLAAARLSCGAGVSDPTAMLGWLESMKAFEPEWVEPFRLPPPAVPTAQPPINPPPASVGCLPCGFQAAFERVLPELLRECHHRPDADELISHVFVTALAAWSKFVYTSDEETDHWFLAVLNTAVAHPQTVHPVPRRQTAFPEGLDPGAVQHPTATLTSGTATPDRETLRGRVAVLHARFPEQFRSTDIVSGLGALASLQLVFLADTLECVLALPDGQSQSQATWAARCLARFDDDLASAALGVSKNNYRVRQTRIAPEARDRLVALWL